VPKGGDIGCPEIKKSEGFQEMEWRMPNKGCTEYTVFLRNTPNRVSIDPSGGFSEGGKEKSEL